MNEPYETTPDGEPHATADYFTRVIAGLLLAMIVLVAASCPAKASEGVTQLPLEHLSIKHLSVTTTQE